jgi:hypothetical protein
MSPRATLAPNLHWRTERNGRRLVQFVCMGGDFDEKAKGNDRTDDEVYFI